MAGELAPEASTSDRAEEDEVPRDVVRPERSSVVDNECFAARPDAPMLASRQQGRFVRAQPSQWRQSYEDNCSFFSNAACAAVHAMLWSVSLPESSQCSPLLRPALAVRECDMSALANICAAARVVICGHQLRSRVKSTRCCEAPDRGLRPPPGSRLPLGVAR